MQIKFDLKVFIFVLFFCLSGDLDLYLILMLFAFLHECGHILVGIILKFKVRKLNILPCGFAVNFKIDTKNYNKKILKGNLLAVKKAIIAISGPIVNLIFIIIFTLISKEKIFNISRENIVYANILIFIFNMLTIYPLDGGRIIKNILYILFGKVRSLEITNTISVITATILNLICIYISIKVKNISYIFVLIYVWTILMKARKINNMKIKVYKIIQSKKTIKENI